MEDFLKFRNDFLRLWYEVAPHTIAYIDYDVMNDIVQIRIDYMLVGNKSNIKLKFIFKKYTCYDIVEILLNICINEDLHRRKKKNDK